jgi:thermitase
MGTHRKRRNRAFSALVALLAASALFAVGAIGAPTEVPSQPVVSDQILVKFQPGSSGRATSAALQAAGAVDQQTIRGLGVHVLHVAASRRESALDALRSSPAVTYAEPDALIAPADVVPNDAWWGGEWGELNTRTTKAWDATGGSPAVKVAILDSGVDASQPDLQANLLPGYDFFNNDSDPVDDYGHGTPAAGVAAARSDNGIGVASYCGHCSILPVKITGSDGYASWSGMASGLTWAADQGARVINLSFAGTSGSTTARDAIAYAHNHGAVVTVSAGNYASSAQTYPAAYPGALPVAATTSTDTLASYSNYGSWVPVAAPGCNYATMRMSASSPFDEFCGTSSAAPAVAGIVALAFSYAPSATNTQVEQALKSTAVPIGSAVAYGRVDAWGTLAALGAQAPPPISPVNTAAPAIVSSNGTPLSGSPQPGQAVGASGGGWSGAAPISLSFQWQRCDGTGAGCTPISGATSQSYVPTSSDAGSTLCAAVTARNSLGSATAVSASSPAVGGTSGGTGGGAGGGGGGTGGSTTTSTTLTGSISAKQPSKSFDLAVGSGDATATLTFAKASSLTLGLLAQDGSTVGTVSGASGIQLVRTLSAGNYRYVVSGKVTKGSASFTLTVRYPAP